MVFEVGKFSVLFDLFDCKGMKKIRIKQSLLRKIYQKKISLVFAEIRRRHHLRRLVKVQSVAINYKVGDIKYIMNVIKHKYSLCFIKYSLYFIE